MGKSHKGEKLHQNKGERIPTRLIYKMIAEQANAPIYVVEDIIRMYQEIVIESLKRDLRITIPNLGSFYLKHRKGYKAGMRMNPATGKVEYREASAPYKVPWFAFTTKFVDSIKDVYREGAEDDETEED